MPDVTAAIYIRVSTEEQTEGWSLEAQRELCTRLALQRGWSVYKVYEEPGQSAKTDRRPVFQHMLREAERQLCWLPGTSIRVDSILHAQIRTDALGSQHRPPIQRFPGEGRIPEDRR
jgi:hypothetical protein